MKENSVSQNYRDKLDEFLAARVAEASDLRESVRTVALEQDPKRLFEALLVCRKASDRLEGILAELVRIRNKSSESVASTKEALDTAWNSAVNNGGRSFNFGEAAPRERYARYSLETFAEARDFRDAERAHRDIETAHAVVLLCHRGVRDTRSDIDSIVRITSLEQRLET